MMEENSNAYSEVIEVLKLVDDEKKLEALPMEMLELLKSKANPEYKPNISKDIPLEEQNLQPETLSILYWISVKYWGESTENFENVENSQNVENTENIENDENVENTENAQNIEENQEPIEKIISNENTLPILVDNLKWYEKIKIKIVEFFNKLFKRNKNMKEEGTAQE
jgi:hypothetical protein